jgi:hypothetical protein
VLLQTEADEAPIHDVIDEVLDMTKGIIDPRPAVQIKSFESS